MQAPSARSAQNNLLIEEELTLLDTERGLQMELKTCVLALLLVRLDLGILNQNQIKCCAVPPLPPVRGLFCTPCHLYARGTRGRQTSTH